MFVHTVIMVIEPHMKQGRQHKLISTIFLATSVTKKLDHNSPRQRLLFLLQTRSSPKLIRDVQMLMEVIVTIRIRVGWEVIITIVTGILHICIRTVYARMQWGARQIIVLQETAAPRQQKHLRSPMI